MKKHFIFFTIVVAFNLTRPSYYERDIPYELHSFDQIKFRQQLIEFYGSIKGIIWQLQNKFFDLPVQVSDHLIEKDIHSHQVAYVRSTVGDELSDIEQHFIKSRKKKIKAQLEKIFSISLDDDRIPNICFCFSGGGFRAMILTLGFLTAAENIGLLDCSLYLAGLSGSTWAIAPWIASGQSLFNVKKRISRNIEKGIKHLTKPHDLSEIYEIIKTKLFNNQMVSIIDIYGCLLAKTLLSNLLPNPHRATLTETHRTVIDGSYPMPIYTTIQTIPKPYEWTEVTPFEIGSSHLQGYIPTWSFGRSFNVGKSKNNAPEQTLGYFLGIFGSAFEVSLKDVIGMTAHNLAKIKAELPSFLSVPLHHALELILHTALSDFRLFPALLPNYSYNMENSPGKTVKELEYVDAGIDFNLPIVPLLRQSRSSDLIIIYDASATVQGAPELKSAEQYARRKGLKFPSINYEKISQNQMTIFKDDQDLSVPIVIYMPRIKNSNYSEIFDPDTCTEHDFCNTFNFTYNATEFELLSGLAEFAVTSHEKMIKSVIAELLTKKYDYQL